MCDTCGCGSNEGIKIHGPGHTHSHDHGHSHSHHHHDHDHEHDHIHDNDNDSDHMQVHEHDNLPPHTHSAGEKAHHPHDHSGQTVINLNVDILSQNNITARMNRRFFEGRKVLCLNLVSSPGSGKTTILEKTISNLKQAGKIYVIEGDQQTLLDAERIEKAGAPALQINTGSGCHLDASMIDSALKKLDVDSNSILFIENVGNLVCPAMFDLGEFKRVVVISVTEGDDKPLKYPYMFQTSHLCIINKSDLLPYVDFKVEETIKHARSINPDLEFISVSARTGEGMDRWFEWVMKQKNI